LCAQGVFLGRDLVKIWVVFVKIGRVFVKVFGDFGDFLRFLGFWACFFGREVTFFLIFSQVLRAS
jgi:hypothetical protein